MDKASRNDPCPCGSGKKYKKCCLGKELPNPAGLLVPDDATLSAAGYRHTEGDYNPAVVCAEDDTAECLFVLARPSRPMDAMEAAGEAGADLDFATDEEGELKSNWAAYLGGIGYKRIAGADPDKLEFLEDLLEEEEEENANDVETLFDWVETQIEEEDPPEVRQTLVRLRRSGFSRSKAIEMMAHVLMHEEEAAAEKDSELDTAHYTIALARLPALPCDNRKTELLSE